MIFYFSGTGNSLFAAKRLLSEGEALISIADAVKQDVCEYDVPAGEAVGLVFPAISTGIYGYPLADATQIAVEAVNEWLEAHSSYEMKVIFICFSDETYECYRVKLGA